MELYEHNQTAYEKIKEQFKQSNKACIIHATGTGKSYIIARLSRDYNRVLIIAPSNYILDAQSKLVDSNCKLITYQSLILWSEFKSDEYDLIVFDEFHHLGAEVWGEASKRLIDSNPNAKILGTSATPLRSDGKNMVDEIFEGNTVSEITLPMAWSMGLLKVPKYVIGLYSFDLIESELRDKINNSNKSEDEKFKSISDLNSIKLDWINSNGTDKIISKYINKDSKRILVFCDKIKYISKLKEEVCSWLTSSGLNIFKCYTVSSKHKNSDKNLRDFELGAYPGVKVLFSVNMINEGLHIPNVDTIILLRPTKSSIIYNQQLGRCLSMDNDATPIVFDLVDNLSSISNLSNLSHELNNLEDNRISKSSKYTTRPRIIFNIIDTLINTRELVDKLSSTYGVKSFGESLQELIEFCETNDRIPYPSKSKLEARLSGFMYRYIDNPTIKELRDKYRKIRSLDENLQELIEFCNTNDRLPIGNRSKLERKLRSFMDTNKDHPAILEIKNKHQSRKIRSFDENLQDLIEFCEVNKKLPNNHESKLSKRLHSFINNNKDHPAILEIKNKHQSKKIRSFDENLQDLIEFCKTNSRLPIGNKSKLENRLCTFIFNYKYHPTIMELKNRYPRIKMRSFDENLQELIEFCEANNRLPRPNESKLERRLSSFMVRYKDYSTIIELKDRYKATDKLRSSDENLQELIEFCEIHKRLPKSRGSRLEGRLLSFMKRYSDHSTIIELRSKYHQNRKIRSFDENLQELIEFCDANDRLPNSDSNLSELRLRSFMSRYKYNPTIIELRSKYQKINKRSFDEILQELIEFCKINNRLPNSDSNLSEVRLRSFMNRHKDHLTIIELRSKYQKLNKRSFDESLQELIEFCKINNRLPHPSKSKLESRLGYIIHAYKDHSTIIELVNKYKKR